MTTLNLKSNNVPYAPEYVTPEQAMNAQVLATSVKDFNKKITLYLNTYLRQHGSDLRQIDGTTLGLKSDGTVAFNTTLTGVATWQDLDLSAIVGQRVTMVALEVTADGACIFAAKPKGCGSATFSDHYNTSGLSVGGSFHCEASGKYGYLNLMTDISGIIQIGASTTTPTVMVTVVGFIA
jgi:hypothetical protein